MGILSPGQQMTLSRPSGFMTALFSPRAQLGLVAILFWLNLFLGDSGEEDRLTSRNSAKREKRSPTLPPAYVAGLSSMIDIFPRAQQTRHVPKNVSEICEFSNGVPDGCTDTTPTTPLR